MLNLRKAGHPVFRGASALEKGSLKSKGGGKLSIHFCGVCETVEVILRTIISVNQLCVYGAIADLCEELASSISDYPTRTGRFVAREKPDTAFSPTDLVAMTHKQKIEDLSEELRMIKVCSDAGFMETVTPGQYFMTIDDTDVAKLD